MKLKKSTKRILSLILVLTFVFSIFSISRASADTKAFELTNAKLQEKSDTAEAEVSLSDGNIKSNVVFHKVNDYIVYKFTFKNNDDKDYIIKSISDDNNNPYIKYTYDQYKDTLIKSKDSIDVLIKVTYDAEVNDIDKRDVNENVKFSFNIEDKEGNKVVSNVSINPKTNDNIAAYIVLSIVSFGGLVLIFVNDKKLKKTIACLVLLTPFVVKAVDSSFELTFKMDIKLRDKLAIEIDNNGEKETKVVSYEDKLTKPEDPERRGYEFLGWYDQNGKEYDFDSKVDDDVKLSAKYKIINYTIDFDYAGGVAINPIEYNVESDSITLVNPIKPGYSFSGWTGSNGEVYQTRVTIDKGSIGNLSFKANFSANEDTTYTVKHRYLNLDGETYIEEVEELTGTTDTTVRPQGKHKDGFVDKEDADLENLVITGDGKAELIYTYNRDEYALTYNTDVDTEFEETSYKYETPITVSAKDKQGYTFNKWNLDSDKYENITTKSNYTFNIVEDTDLAPIYDPNNDTPYLVKHYKQNIGGGNHYTYVETDELTGITDTDVRPSVKSYEGFTAPDTELLNIKPDGSSVLEYKYARDQHTLTVIDSENVVQDKTGSYYYEEEVTITAKDINNYTFVGWEVNGIDSDITTKDITLTMGTSNISVKPIYEIVKYTVTFNPNGEGATVNVASTEVDAGSNVNLPTPTRDGYTFAGWYESVGCTGTAVSDPYTPSQTITLYAKWEEASEPIAYLTDLDGDLDISLGDKVTIGEDEFYFIGRDDNGNLKLLAKYNLDSNYRQSKDNYNSSDFSSTNYWGSAGSSSSSSGSGSSSNYGFNTYGSDYKYVYRTLDNNDIAENNLTNYVNNYKDYITSETEINVFDARLMSYEEATKLGCNVSDVYSCPEWVDSDGSSGFWLGSAYDDTQLFLIYDTDLSICSGHFKWAYGGLLFGIRPVIIVDESDISVPWENNNTLLYSDTDNDGNISLGDAVRIGSEGFRVIDEPSNGEIKLLAMYNISFLNGSQRQWTRYDMPTQFGGNWNIDNVSDYDPLLSSQYKYVYRNANGSDANNYPHNRLNAYKERLDYLGIVAVKDIRLVSYEEIANTGCSSENNSCPTWVVNQSYWLGSAYSNDSVWFVNANDQPEFEDIFEKMYFFYSSYIGFGVRPVIIISESDIPTA